MYTDARQAIESILEFEKRIEPQPALHNAYQAFFEIYSDLYPTLKSLSHRLNTDRNDPI